MHSSAGPGIIVNVPKSRAPTPGGGGRPAASAGAFHRRSTRRSTVTLDMGGGSRSGRSSAAARSSGLSDMDVERLSYVNTALQAVPGATLRRFFAPVMRVRARLLTRRLDSQRRLGSFGGGGGIGSSSGGVTAATTVAAAPPAVITKARRDAVNQLCAALVAAGSDVIFDAAMPLDAGALAELLGPRLEPVSYRADDSIAYPCEPPEAAFVYIVVSGSVRATHYHQQLCRPAAAAGGGSGAATPAAAVTTPNANGSTTSASPAAAAAAAGAAVGVASRVDRRQYLTSNEEVFHLSTIHGGSGGGGGDADGGDTTGGGGAAATVVNDTGSVSNMTAAIQRSLRKASRAAGQPTLAVARTDTLSAPCVIGAAEALGLAPGRCTAYAATATAAPVAAGTIRGGGGGGMEYATHTDILRVRALDLHAALLELARRDAEARHALSTSSSGAGGRAGATTAGAAGATTTTTTPPAPSIMSVAEWWLSAPRGALPPRGVPRTMGDFLAAARAKCLQLHYSQHETAMRQSWLLQDTPTAALRALCARLTPRTYLPGEVIACPHVNSSASRQLCFLRRGRMLIVQTPSSTGGGGGSVAFAVDSTNGSSSNAGHSCAICIGGGGGARASTDGPPWTSSPPPPPAIKVLEVVHSGASFGELSVLFGESRDYTLVADSVCDVWCLPHTEFARTMRRDDALRSTMVDKAASLRIKWLQEQRFTSALADHLRAHSEMLRPFPDMALRLIQERVEPVVYSPGQLVTSTSQRCEEVIFIIQGRVRSICEGVASYGPGAVLGEGCLVAHRWPLGLAALTMVEGWRLPRASLVTALAKAQQLAAHSGELTSLAPAMMKDIFMPPVPEVECDVVGRLRMPVVAGAPGGLTYPEFARKVAEVQLKALCMTYRDYVKWEDINYATMDRHEAAEVSQSGAIAREMVIARLRGAGGDGDGRGGGGGGVRSSPATTGNDSRRAAAGGPQRFSSIAAAIASQAAAETTAGAAAGSGRSAASRLSIANAAATAPHAPPAPAAPASSSNSKAKGNKKMAPVRPRRANTGASAFLLDPSAMAAPFTRRAPGARRSQSSAVEAEEDAARDAANSNSSTGTGRAAESQLLPRLRGLTRALAERDRALAAERRQEAETDRRLAAQQTASVREHLAASTTAAATVTAAGRGGDPNTGTAAAASSRGGGGVRRPSAVVLSSVGRGSAASAAALVSDPVPLTDPIPPVHVFLSGDRPRTEISMAEAISIGYVLQLPDSQSIQSCVSFVDPDVTVGPPLQRSRRHAMAVTPNDRHHRRNFLFAAAVFESATDKLEEALCGLRAEERLRRTKAQRLLAMMQANANSDHWQQGGRTATANRGNDPRGDGNGNRREGGGGGGGDDDDDDDGFPPSPRAHSYDSGSGGGSGGRNHRQQGLPLPLLDVPTTPMHVTASGQIELAGGIGGRIGIDSGLYTPSPFGASPPRAGYADRKEEAFERLLSRDPAAAAALLRARYQVAPNTTAAPPTATGSSSSRPGTAGPTRPATPLATGTTTTRSGGSSLLDRLRDAAAGGHGNTTLPPPSEGEHDADGPAAVVMTDAGGHTPLAVASLRDRHHAERSYLHPAAATAAAGGGGGVSSIFDASGHRSLSTSVLMSGAAAGASGGGAADPGLMASIAALEHHVAHRRDSVLFVDGFGAIDVSPEAAAAGCVVMIPAVGAAAATAAAAADRRGSLSRSGATVAFAIYNNTDGNRHRNSTSSGGVTEFASAGIHGGSNSNMSGFLTGAGGGGGGGYNYHGQQLTPADFHMPCAEDAAAMMRRIQRDTDGLNAAAREQTRDRKAAKLREQRLGVAAIRCIEAALAAPTEEEALAMDAWRHTGEVMARDPYLVALVPNALLPQAGPDYLRYGIEVVGRAVAEEAAAATGGAGGGGGGGVAGVAAWQDQQQMTMVLDGPNAGGTSRGVSPSAPGGKNRPRPTIHATSTTATSTTAARRTVAAVGTGQLGYRAVPLVSPATLALDGAAHDRYVREREAFFDAFRADPAAVLSGAVGEPRLPAVAVAVAAAGGHHSPFSP